MKPPRWESAGRHRALLRIATLAGCCAAMAGAPLAAAQRGRLVLELVEAATGQPTAARLHLRNAAGVPVRVKRWPFFHDHVTVEGRVELELDEGEYEFELERGPEYPVTSGHFSLSRFADDRKTVSFQRVADLAAEGWWSADLHVHRPPRDIDLLLRAEDLHLAPVITWWNEKNAWAGKKPPARPLVNAPGPRAVHLLAGEDERAGGALLFFNLPTPLDLSGSQAEFPSGLHFAKLAREQPGAWIEAEKPFWWDLPLWLAHGVVDSIGLAHNHLQRGQVLDNEAWGRPRDPRQFPGPRGNPLWSQHIYYQVLEAGLRIPPTAGSASGVLPNPVGYNRVYVHLGGEFSWHAWWEGLRAGRSMVTNGPLLRVQVADQRPGHVFRQERGMLELPIEIQLAARDPLRAIEVVQNGQVVQTLPLDANNPTQPRPVLRFEESGWFLVRVTAAVESTYRFASTGPYYVEFEAKPRISRQACEFFLDWLARRQEALHLESASQQAELEALFQQAGAFWRARREQATAP